jgi:HTH-type transcriptional regulator / antitoxin HipB
MTDTEKYIAERKKKSKKFAAEFEKGYILFETSVLLKQTRENAGITQGDVAKKLKTRKSQVMRIENSRSDIRLSTLERFANALGKRAKIVIE